MKNIQTIYWLLALATTLTCQTALAREKVEGAMQQGQRSHVGSSSQIHLVLRDRVEKSPASLLIEKWNRASESSLRVPLSARSASLTVARVNENPSVALRWAEQRGKFESLLQVEHQSDSRLTQNGDRSLSVGLSKGSLSLKQSAFGEVGGYYQFDRSQRSWGVYAETQFGASPDLGVKQSKLGRSNTIERSETLSRTYSAVSGRLSYQQSGARNLETSQFGLRLSSSNTCFETEVAIKQHRRKTTSEQRVESIRSKLRQKLGPSDSVELSMEMSPNSLMTGSRRNPSLNRSLQLRSVRLGYDRRLARDLNWSSGVRVSRLPSGEWAPEIQSDINWQW